MAGTAGAAAAAGGTPPETEAAGTSGGQPPAGGKAGKKEPKPLAASQMAKAYAEYIARLGRTCQSGETASERETAACQLLVHVYSVHVAHLTSGMRVGAAAAERLNLFASGAIGMYYSYPEGVKEPMGQFRGWLDKAGESLSSYQKEAVFKELPKGIMKTGLLLSALAHEN